MEPTVESTEKVLRALEAWAADLPADQRSALHDILALAAFGAEVATRPADEVAGFSYAVSELMTMRLQMKMESYNTTFAMLSNVLKTFNSSTPTITGNVK